jgi:hypothetical protein
MIALSLLHNTLLHIITVLLLVRHYFIITLSLLHWSAVFKLLHFTFVHFLVFLLQHYYQLLRNVITSK